MRTSRLSPGVEVHASENMDSVPAVLSRGGTSKGLLFLAADLPADKTKWDQILLSAMGAPHPRQIDGVGGGESTTSKTVIISKSARSDADIDYLFAQVNPNSPIVDFASNCGNMLSAVGPFAIEKGFVTAGNPTTNVRIYNINTDSVIGAEVQTPGGKVTYEGSAAIDGVPGTAAPVRLDFASTVGIKTKKLLPTGRVREIIDGIEVTLIDVAVPAMIVTANSVGKTGSETKAELDDPMLIAKLEDMRQKAGIIMGLGDCKDLVVPKPILVAAPTSRDSTILPRDFVPFSYHPAFSVTGSIAVATACLLRGSVAAEVACRRIFNVGSNLEKLCIGHPSGSIEIELDVSEENGDFQLLKASLIRIARKIFEGRVFL